MVEWRYPLAGRTPLARFTDTLAVVAVVVALGWVPLGLTFGDNPWVLIIACGLWGAIGMPLGALLGVRFDSLAGQLAGFAVAVAGAAALAYAVTAPAKLGTWWSGLGFVAAFVVVAIAGFGLCRDADRKDKRR